MSFLLGVFTILMLCFILFLNSFSQKTFITSNNNNNNANNNNYNNNNNNNNNNKIIIIVIITTIIIRNQVARKFSFSFT